MIQPGDPIVITTEHADLLAVPGDIGRVLDVRYHPRDDRLMCYVDLSRTRGWLPAAQLELDLFTDMVEPELRTTTVRFHAEPAESLDDLTRPLCWD